MARNEPPRLRLDDLIDMGEVRGILKAHNRVTSILNAIVDAVDGRILAAAGWQDICTKFHRINPVTRARCTESDLTITGRLKLGESYAYKCSNGLWDIGTPIIIKGQHSASIFLGQFFYEGEDADQAFFERQAAEFGFDKTAYLDALSRVPVFSREKVEDILSYNKAFAAFLGRSAENILEQRLAKIDATAQKAFVQRLIETVPTPIFFKDRDLRYIGCNPAFERQTGHTNETIRGKTGHDLYSPELAATYDTQDRALLDGGGVQQYEAKLRERNGRLRDAIFYKSAFTDASGQVAGIVGVAMDITERKKAEEEADRARKAAEESSRTKTEFLATMSHEIRTPLNGVLGMLQLARSTALTPEQAGYVDTAMQSGRSLLRVLSDVLDISRIEAGALVIIAEDFRPAEIFEPIVQAFRDQASAIGVDFFFALDPGFPAVLRGDAGRIRQVVYNLVGNALKYTESGEVRMEACILSECGEPGKVRLLLAVTDTGIGVPEEKVRDIFDAFTQADGSYTRRYGGTGLGLAIVKRLVGLMGGDIFFCSRAGEGTEVHVMLPLESTPEMLSATPPPLPAPDSPAAAQGLYVLLAEDDPVNRLTVSHMLVKIGHRVQAVSNGAEAMAYLADHRIDCVLMDIQMPELDGLKATRLIRARQTGATPGTVPIIAITAYAMKGDRDEFLAAGMDGYISKPVDMAELERVLSKVVPRGNHKN